MNFINKYKLQTIFLQTWGGIPLLGYRELNFVLAVFTVLTSTLLQWASPQEKSQLYDNYTIEIQPIIYKWSLAPKFTLFFFTSQCPAADIVSSHSQQLSTCCKHLCTHGSWNWLPPAHSSQDEISGEGFQWGHPCWSKVIHYLALTILCW